ncbi:MAG: glutamate synthase subunit beta [Flavobacteriales bacterium]|nr:glutamate synthase subunit beta [Flavobacteriales bacterium]
MGRKDGFMLFEREVPGKESVAERIKHYKEFVDETSPEMLENQSARCMDCGIPFCQSGCPLGNIIPEFNEAVHKKHWKKAYDILSTTNNFPEFTGRICPAPCEGSCVLGINEKPVTIEEIEKNIIEIAFKEGFVKPNQPKIQTGYKVAVIGSGPAGLAAADQLNKAGHAVTVFERDAVAGGLLRYGIPDFKLEKSVVQRRVDLMEQSGVRFKLNHEVGKDVTVGHLFRHYRAVVLAVGSTIPRDLSVPGRDAKGIHFAMEFLKQSNERVNGLAFTLKDEILATGKNVIVIGGGDTGSDCVGTSNRQGAKSVTQVELMPMPPKERDETMPWPMYPMILKTTTSHEEGVERKYAVNTKEFLKDDKGNLKGIKFVELEWSKNPETGRYSSFVEKSGSEFVLDCELVLFAMGFLHVQHKGLVEQLGVDIDPRGNLIGNTREYKTNVKKVYSCGDARRGQSLVVWAINEGRECAAKVHEYLMSEENV